MPHLPWRQKTLVGSPRRLELGGCSVSVLSLVLLVIPGELCPPAISTGSHGHHPPHPTPLVYSPAPCCSRHQGSSARALAGFCPQLRAWLVSEEAVTAEGPCQEGRVSQAGQPGGFSTWRRGQEGPAVSRDPGEPPCGWGWQGWGVVWGTVGLQLTRLLREALDPLTTLRCLSASQQSPPCFSFPIHSLEAEVWARRGPGTRQLGALGHRARLPAHCCAAHVWSSVTSPACRGLRHIAPASHLRWGLSLWLLVGWGQWGDLIVLEGCVQ